MWSCPEKTNGESPIWPCFVNMFFENLIFVVSLTSKVSGWILSIRIVHEPKIRWVWGTSPYKYVYIYIYMGVSENGVPLNPMVLLIIIPIKWLFHWEYTQHFQTNPYTHLYDQGMSVATSRRCELCKGLGPTRPSERWCGNHIVGSMDISWHIYVYMLCVYVYIYIYTNIYVCICMYVYIYICVCMCIYIATYIYIYIFFTGTCFIYNRNMVSDTNL